MDLIEELKEAVDYFENSFGDEGGNAADWANAGSGLNKEIKSIINKAIIAESDEVVVRLKRDVVKVAWCCRDCETCSDPKYNNAGDCKCCQAWDAIENQLKAALEEK